MPTVGRKAPNKTHVQSVLMAKSRYTKAQSRGPQLHDVLPSLEPHEAEAVRAFVAEWTGRSWIKSHTYKADGYESTTNNHRWRQYDPEASRFRYRAKKIATGISLVNGFVK